ncbi:MAG: hypothetical protein JXR95_07795 [Deltaproteobacteria bacterium]|nr:hypothetical protein [Deltaproteobacteria bacterium]
MGFFSKIFGSGKKNSGEFETIENEDSKNEDRSQSGEIKVEIKKEEKVETVEKEIENKPEIVKPEKKEEPKTTQSGEISISSRNIEEKSDPALTEDVKADSEIDTPHDDHISETEDDVESETAEKESDVEAAPDEEEESSSESEIAVENSSEPDDNTPESAKTDFEDDSLFGGGTDTVSKNESSKPNAALSSHIECFGCSRRLPIPFVGYSSKITCPFCLSVNEYRA